MPDDLSVPEIVFRAAGAPPFPVFDEHGEDVAPVLTDVARGGALSTATLSVGVEHATDFRAYLMRCLPRVAGNRDMEDDVRAWILHRALLFEVDAVLSGQAGNARGLLEVTRDFGREGASWAGTGNVPAYRHRERLATEFTPLDHAVNATMYATGLAAATGEHSYEVLQGVALASVFADYGLDALTDAARVDQSAIFMRRAGVTSVGAAAGVLARLARWDGGGIPDRLAGPAIPFEARCVAIACDYDLLTLAGSPHCEARSPYDALSTMGARAGAYDPTLLRIFILLIGNLAIDAPDRVPRPSPAHQVDQLREIARAIRDG